MASHQENIPNTSASEKAPVDVSSEGTLDGVAEDPPSAKVISFADPAEDIEATYGVNERALLRKLDLRLLPPLTLLYLLSFLDRSNGELEDGASSV